jgi:hypothetical protein
MSAELNAQGTLPFNYVTNQGTITVTRYTGQGGALTIPAEINGWPVTAIGGIAFRDNTTLTEINLPEGLKTVGLGAFYRCTSLSKVSLPDSLTAIRDNSFIGCTSLSKISLPSRLTTIGDLAFADCTSLAQVTFFDQLKTIGYGAFSGCNALAEIVLPNSLTALGGYAFADCKAVTQVTLPSALATIGAGVFAYCDGLTMIRIPDSNPNFASFDGVFFDKAGTSLLQYPAGRTGSYAVADQVNSIGGGAFAGAITLTQVVLPNSLTNIGHGAFYGCTRLPQVTLPDSLTAIGGSAFYNCTSLTQVALPANLSTLEAGAFSGCLRLKVIQSPDSNPNFASIDGVLFDKLGTSLLQYPAGKAESYAIPDRVTTIGSTAFSGSISLTQITLPNSVTTIGSGAFAGCSTLSQVTLSDHLGEVGGQAFSGCLSLSRLLLPSSLTNIGIYAFSGCSSLTHLFFAGNAPSANNPFRNTFDPLNILVTVYYLPGSTGWENTFGGRPTALWLPDLGTPTSTSGLPGDPIGFPIQWAPGRQVALEACTDLTQPDWQTVGSVALDAVGNARFTDPNSPQAPMRLYRARIP